MKLIVITGASSGIGFDACVRMAGLGHTVLACARRTEDLERLKTQSPLIHGALLDVTQPDQIQNLLTTHRELLERAEQVSLVNNAGIAISGPLEAIPISQLRFQFEVNCIGLVAVTQALLPWIRETKGRIVNISSISGLQTTPFLGAYCGSKHTVEALSDALRRELGRLGVKVVIIEPGAIATPIWEKGLSNEAKTKSLLLQDRLPVYEESMDRFIKVVSGVAADGLPVSKVSDAIERALTKPHPPTRILVVKPSTWLQLKLFRFLPDVFVDTLINRMFRLQ